MKLTISQQKRVNDFLEEEWADINDREEVSMKNLLALLSKVESPYELDAMVSGFNWDCGIESLKPVLEHSLIDPGTILKAFWLSGPGYFSQYETEDQIEAYQLEGWLGVKYLKELAIKSLEKSSVISFDPNAEYNGIVWAKQYEREERRLQYQGKTPFFSIPDELRRSV